MIYKVYYQCNEKCKHWCFPLLIKKENIASSPKFFKFLIPHPHNSNSHKIIVQFSSVQSLSCVRFFATPWIAARQASLSITNSRSSLRLTSIESGMPSSHLILRRPLLLLAPVLLSIKVFSSESTLRIRWPKYWSFSFSIIPSKEIPGWSPSEWTGWIS